jgi:uncharacterized protein (TIGR00369 family)
MDHKPQFAVTPREELAGKSGLEFLHDMIAGRLPAPPMSQTLGFRLVEAERERVVFEGRPSASLLNPLGSVHGGWALTLIDSATGCALQTVLDAGFGYTTVETKVNFVRPIAPDGELVRCEGRLLSRGRQIATAEARLVSSQGKLLAHGSSTLMILAARAEA